VAQIASGGGISTSLITAICLLLFLGACGKSAQIPLYVWLPDAMAGPTPVSALIHAATMVTAGVYMIARTNVLYRLAPNAMMVVAIVGGLTALFAATIGLRQFDIKKVLAYSTVSQLGFMFIGVGVGAFSAGIFHLVTHAFFKACLFLGSGSVIHAMSGEQDIRKMGGLRTKIPQTYRTFAIATYAIAGLPLAAGFFSKDEILANAYGYAPVLWGIGIVAATFTSFYMFRLYFMTFAGDYRGAKAVGIEESEPTHGHDDLIPAHTHLDDGDQHSTKGHGHHAHSHDPHESPVSMTGVLWILAILSVVGGYVGFPVGLFGGGETPFQKWLAPVLLPIGGHNFQFHEAPHSLELLLMGISVAIGFLGLVVAFCWYSKDSTWSVPKRIAAAFPGAYRVVFNKYYVDEIYQATVIRGTIVFSLILSWIDANVIDGLVNFIRHFTVYILGHGSSLFDKYVVDGAVNGVGYSARGGSTLIRRVQNGLVQNYALIMGSGVVLLAAIYLLTKP
jgi:NADH-quinone oxidoreductase subunit L